MWSSYIDRLVNGLDLEPHEISAVMETILLGKADVSEIKSFLVALKN
jgi:anthranilate phosphoribosyltransferase